MAIAALSLLAASRYTRHSHSDRELHDVETSGDDALGRLEWIDDSYSVVAATATVLALLGAVLATDTTDKTAHQDDNENNQKNA